MTEEALAEVAAELAELQAGKRLLVKLLEDIDERIDALALREAVSRSEETVGLGVDTSQVILSVDTAGLSSTAVPMRCCPKCRGVGAWVLPDDTWTNGPPAAPRTVTCKRCGGAGNVVAT